MFLIFNAGDKVILIKGIPCEGDTRTFHTRYGELKIGQEFTIASIEHKNASGYGVHNTNWYYVKGNSSDYFDESCLQLADIYDKSYLIDIR